MTQDARATLTAYYDALAAGEPLSPFFAEVPDAVKIGIGERLVGYADIAVGLSKQTATTTSWTVESHDLSVTERDGYAWFSDLVSLSWTNVQTDTDYAFETRWTGTLERRGDDGDDDRWRFVCLHVSAPNERLVSNDDDLFAWDD